MAKLVPVVNEMITGKEQSIEIIVKNLNKNVTDSDGEVKLDFITAFNKSENLVDGKKVYKYDDGTIIRNHSQAIAGYMPVYINSDGILLPGEERKYSTHTLFKPENLTISVVEGVIVANYQTKKRTGGTKRFKVDLSFDKIGVSASIHMETRKVAGFNMNKKPSGIGRGRTDSAGKGFENAHLIGDRFGGSGYNNAFNIYPSSIHYNQVTMKNKESHVYGQITTEPFNMSVEAKIKHASYSSGKLSVLLNEEFNKDNAENKDEVEVKDGITEKLRSKIKTDVDKFPGKFNSVEYRINDVSMGTIGEDTDYYNAIKKRIK